MPLLKVSWGPLGKRELAARLSVAQQDPGSRLQTGWAAAVRSQHGGRFGKESGILGIAGGQHNSAGVVLKRLMRPWDYLGPAMEIAGDENVHICLLRIIRDRSLDTKCPPQWSELALIHAG